MNPEEYEVLARVEREHWFYRGKRRIASEWVNRILPEPQGKVLVDVGCGTGCFAEQMIQKGYSMIGIDDHQESIDRARVLLGEKNFREGSAEKFPFEEATVDVVTLLDVLEHLKDDRLALESLYRGIKPGGYLILTVPAFEFFWSDWDRSLHHYRRYSAKNLLSLMKEVGFEISFWNFINVLAFPAVYLIRQWREWSGKQENPWDRPENRIPWGPLNRVLEWQFVRLATQKWIRFPFGVSLLVVARKPRTS
ncbi:MAG: class I SAM-dependent methyltransferase [Verrucomicrobiota bacterium]